MDAEIVGPELMVAAAGDGPEKAGGAAEGAGGELENGGGRFEVAVRGRLD